MPSNQTEFMVIKTTTEKLEDALNSAFEAGYVEIVQAQFQGGRDWIVIVRMGEE